MRHIHSIGFINDPSGEFVKSSWVDLNHKDLFSQFYYTCILNLCKSSQFMLEPRNIFHEQFWLWVFLPLRKVGRLIDSMFWRRYLRQFKYTELYFQIALFHLTFVLIWMLCRCTFFSIFDYTFKSKLKTRCSGEPFQISL